MKIKLLPGCAQLDSRGRLSLRELFGLIVAILREIFDESAYERFLLRHQLTSSAAAYSSFCRERDLSRARRPRCC